MSRGLIYPDESLVVGAYASYDLEEYVHGVTGIPEEGAVIRYSSRGLLQMAGLLLLLYTHGISRSPLQRRRLPRFSGIARQLLPWVV